MLGIPCVLLTLPLPLPAADLNSGLSPDRLDAGRAQPR
jgi:hypothetical protein